MFHKKKANKFLYRQYQPKVYHNPYTHSFNQNRTKNNSHRFKFPKISWRLLVWLIIGAAVLAGLAWIFFCTNFNFNFFVKKPSNSAQSILPAQTIWQENNQYYFLDRNGVALGQISQPATGYPLIHNVGAPELSAGQVTRPMEYFAFVSSLFQQWPLLEPGLAIKEFQAGEGDVVAMVLEPGPKINFSTIKDLNQQVEKLQLLLKTELKNKLNKINYINLQYGDKIFYQ